MACLLALSVPGLARAQSAAEAESAAVERHNRLGIEHYKAGRFPEAVREMLEAYRLAPEPGLLYNIARIYQKMGENELALQYFQEFVTSKDVDPGDVKKALENMSVLRETIRQQNAAESSEKPAAVASGELVIDRTTWIVGGTGAALFVSGVVLGAMASGAHSDFTAATSTGAGPRSWSHRGDTF